MLESGNMNRFAKVGNFSSYCRCVKSERISNGKKKSKTNGIIATKTVANKLARACYHVLKDQVAFDVNKSFS